MQLKLDKTIVLVAATKALLVLDKDNEIYAEDTLQEIVDVLSGRNSEFIQSIELDPYEYSLIEPFLENV
jgi:hypothetical protein